MTTGKHAFDFSNKTFGERLKIVRKSSGLTQGELADKLRELNPWMSVSQTKIAAWEQRDLPLTRIDELTALSDYFGVQLGALDNLDIRKHIVRKLCLLVYDASFHLAAGDDDELAHVLADARGLARELLE